MGRPPLLNPPPYVPREADGFKTVRLSAAAVPPPNVGRDADLGRVNVDNGGAWEYAVTTYMRFDGRIPGVAHDPVHIIGTVEFGHGDWQTGERCDFDWRHGLSLRVCGSSVSMKARYESVARLGAPTVLVGATLTVGGSPARGEVTRTVLNRFLVDVDNNAVVQEIPRRAQTTRLVCRTAGDYGRFILQFWEEGSGATPVLRWLPLSPSDEVPVPFGATDFSIAVVAGAIDADVQFVLEL